MKLEHSLTPYTKINLKWIKDLNVRPKTIKLLGENTGKTLSDIHHSRILYDPPPRILEIKAKINKWDLIKIKSFCTTKETIDLKFKLLKFFIPSTLVSSLFEMENSFLRKNLHSIICMVEAKPLVNTQKPQTFLPFTLYIAASVF